MTLYTTNYNLDKYEGIDKPNLRDQYNSAMDKIDSVLKTQEDKQAHDKQELSDKLNQDKDELIQKIEENKNELDVKIETEKIDIVYDRLNVINATIPANKKYVPGLTTFKNYTNTADRRRIQVKSRTEILTSPFICLGAFPSFSQQEPVGYNITSVIPKYETRIDKNPLKPDDKYTYTLIGIELNYDLFRLNTDELLDSPLSITGGFLYAITSNSHVIYN